MSALRVNSGTRQKRTGPKTLGTKPYGSFRQQAPASLDKDPRTHDDVGICSILTPMMADAADRGHEHHAGRHDRGENLGVMTRGAGHADRPAAGIDRAGLFDGVLERGIHHGGSAGTKTLHR